MHAWRAKRVGLRTSMDATQFAVKQDNEYHPSPLLMYRIKPDIECEFSDELKAFLSHLPSETAANSLRH